MIRTFMLTMLLAVSSTAIAQTAPNPCDNIPEATKNMSQLQINTILETCRAKPATTIIEKVGAEVTPEAANTWANAAKGFAQALGIAAKELGVATNEFLNSPAGYLLAAILLVNYAGGALIGLPFTVFTLMLMVWLIRRVTHGTTEYESVPLLWGALTYRRVKSTSTVAPSSDGGALLVLSAIGLLVINLIVWVNIN